MIIYVPALVFGAIALFFFWAWWQQGQFKKYVNGAVLCTFITAHGTSYDKVLPVEGDVILPPSGIWQKKKDRDKNWGNYQLPPRTYTCMYPLGGWPANLKVEVKRVFLFETKAGTFEALDTSTPRGTSPQSMVANRNEKIIGSLLKPDGEYVKGATTDRGGSGMKSTKMLFYLQIVTLGALLVVGALCYLIYAAQAGHIAAWGG